MKSLNILIHLKFQGINDFNEIQLQVYLDGS